ncbi:protein FAR1-RELATED SEQUENCE 5-like [Ananas comosus]|uniref:Protein FAR1-RELATED SEQUENCE 5-like n=1 Tax=Ananas comosus TaxID=4615 RepID=A0A6P5GLF7_ANACO|nr:protein FAR1-RELATED SEQUENCE 5-like [Ananas comosus]
MEHGSIIGSSVSMSNLDVRDEVNEEIGKIVANDHTSNVSKYPVDEIRVGLEFTCIEDAKKFYNDYAFKMGFSIRKQTHYKARKQDDAITSITYCCSKAGNSKPTSQEKSEQQNSQGTHTPQKDFPNRRTNCKAHIVLKIDDRGKWVITVFANEHNHELIASPSKTRFFRSHRNITKEQKDLIHMLNEQNISASQIMSFLEVKEGGRHNTQFIRKDLSNEVVEKNRKLIGIDVASALNYFRKLQRKDPLFFYAVDVDDQERARNIFWVDGRSRMAYEHFGDVITFDTTYMTNNYSIPFTPFIGVNHHFQSIFFGCALIRDETANTFCWLFETWIKAMYGKHPKAIITDQDPAMKKAIEIVFPTTVHRCCQWHVMRKAKEHFNVLYSSKDGFENNLKECINNSLTMEEFENAWAIMLDKYQLHENNHLRLLWNIRHQWVPVYFRDTFFANMSTSQRSESMNAVAKIWLDSHTSIFKFVTQFEKMSNNQYEREDMEDFMTKDEEPTLWSDDPIEKDARSIYTRTIFSEFKAQLRATTGYKLVELEKDKLYKISSISQPSTSRQRMCTYTITVVRSEDIVSCTCKLFEFYGLLCAHALKVMHHIEVYSIPPRYVIKRWIKNAKKGTSTNSLEMSDGSLFCRS